MRTRAVYKRWFPSSRLTQKVVPVRGGAGGGTPSRGNSLGDCSGQNLSLGYRDEGLDSWEKENKEETMG